MMRINLRSVLYQYPCIIKEFPRLSKKEWLLAPIELASKALHKNKDSIR
ncbi:hypothetical protein HPCPY1313_0941 [Helicobacter pylori CPY1313]|nr:hypothetical protein HPCPY1313_0941 [Helicobacter pylori CPY1313]